MSGSISSAKPSRPAGSRIPAYRETPNFTIGSSCTTGVRKRCRSRDGRSRIKRMGRGVGYFPRFRCLPAVTCWCWHPGKMSATRLPRFCTPTSSWMRAGNTWDSTTIPDNSPQGAVYAKPIVLASSTRIKARVFLNEQRSPVTEAAFAAPNQSGAGHLRDHVSPA